MQRESDLERLFWEQWRRLAPKAPTPTREWRVCPTRKWRFDFAWPAHRVAVEVEGGVYSEGRHTRGRGFEADCEKYNIAAASGWCVIRLTHGMLTRDPARWVDVIRDAMENGGDHAASKRR